MATVTVGVDIGQQVDPTAVAVAELEERKNGTRMDDHYLVRHLERLPLGTSYPGVADRLAAVVQGVRGQVATRPLAQRSLVLRIYLDATGVGKPVVDVLRDRGLRVTGCYFTHGDRRTADEHGVTIGKAWLVSRLQVLLQSDRLHLPQTPEATVLAKELLDYEIRVDENANDTYGAFKVGTHDDLVTALGLAVQGGDRAPRLLVTRYV